MSHNRNSTVSPLISQSRLDRLARSLRAAWEQRARFGAVVALDTGERFPIPRTAYDTLTPTVARALVLSIGGGDVWGTVYDSSGAGYRVTAKSTRKVRAGGAK